MSPAADPETGRGQQPGSRGRGGASRLRRLAVWLGARFGRSQPAAAPDFPDTGILWRRWNEATQCEIAERARPVLLFVADPLAPVFMFLREIFRVMPKNPALRVLLDQEFIGLYVEAAELSDDLGAFGAGERYHIAILSPHGLNAMVTFDPVRGDPDAVVAEIVQVLERLREAYG